MRALYIHGEKDLRLQEIPDAVIGADEVAVRIKAAGICGSDLHYYLHGGFGPVRLKEPLILGHEIAGEVASVGAGVRDVMPGMRVAIDPSRPCRQCDYCRKAQYRHCTEMRFFGSALRFPHVQGGFREVLAVPAAQVFPISDALQGISQDDILKLIGGMLDVDKESLQEAIQHSSAILLKRGITPENKEQRIQLLEEMDVYFEQLPYSNIISRIKLLLKLYRELPS